jgi:hypothetical protein
VSDSPVEKEKEKEILRAALRSELTYFSEIEIYISVFLSPVFENIVTAAQVSSI